MRPACMFASSKHNHTTGSSHPHGFDVGVTNHILNSRLFISACSERCQGTHRKMCTLLPGTFPDSGLEDESMPGVNAGTWVTRLARYAGEHPAQRSVEVARMHLWRPRSRRAAGARLCSHRLLHCSRDGVVKRRGHPR